MIYHKMSAADAIRTVRLRRDIFPNDGFLQQLADLCNDLRTQRQWTLAYYLFLQQIFYCISYSTYKFLRVFTQETIQSKYKHKITSRSDFIVFVIKL